MSCSACGHVFFPDQEDDMAMAFTDHVRKAHQAEDDPSQALDEDHPSQALNEVSKGLHGSGLD